MFIPCAVKYALCFYAGCQFYRAFFFMHAETPLFLVVFLSAPSKDGWNRE